MREVRLKVWDNFKLNLINLINKSAYTAVIHGYKLVEHLHTFSDTFSNESGLTNEKQTRNTSCKQKETNFPSSVGKRNWGRQTL